MNGGCFTCTCHCHTQSFNIQQAAVYTLILVRIWWFIFIHHTPLMLYERCICLAVFQLGFGPTTFIVHSSRNMSFHAVPLNNLRATISHRLLWISALLKCIGLFLNRRSHRPRFAQPHCNNFKVVCSHASIFNEHDASRSNRKSLRSPLHTRKRAHVSEANGPITPAIWALHASPCHYHVIPFSHASLQGSCH